MRTLPLPMRDGVGASCVSLPQGPWRTIADFLCERFTAITPAAWQARIAAGDVVDEHGVVVTASRAYLPRLRVYYYRALADEPVLPFEEEILFQDEQLLVVDKPHFMPVTPVGKYVQQSLLVRLKRRLGIEALVPMHRIDRETAGIVLFSVASSDRAAYSAMFAERAVHKRYEAIVPWTGERELPAVRHSRMVPDAHFMRMREAEGEPNAETRFTLIEAHDGWARLGLSPVTGRRHQLRVHCAAIGLPIRHDAIYPVLRPEGQDDFERPLQLLARHIAFRDPVTGAAREFSSRRSLALAPR
jgi:tRNA pseudouridine32 synthase/23S rRNA pseudouridine746 synthase